MVKNKDKDNNNSSNSLVFGRWRRQKYEPGKTNEMLPWLHFSSFLPEDMITILRMYEDWIQPLGI